MGRSRMRNLYVLLALLLTLLVLTPCCGTLLDEADEAKRAEETPDEGVVSEKESARHQAADPGARIASETQGDTAQAGGDSFVTWDRRTTIPFLLAADLSGADAYYLGLWNLESGTVSFESKPLFVISPYHYGITWDGGNRFGCIVVDSDGFWVRDVDPRIRLDIIADDTVNPVFCASPSSGSTFVVHREEPGKLVLDVRDHPLACKMDRGGIGTSTRRRPTVLACACRSWRPTPCMVTRS